MATQSHKDKENFYHFSYILNREVYVWEGFLPGNGFGELERHRDMGHTWRICALLALAELNRFHL